MDETTIGDFTGRRIRDLVAAANRAKDLAVVAGEKALISGEKFADGVRTGYGGDTAPRPAAAPTSGMRTSAYMPAQPLTGIGSEAGVSNLRAQQALHPRNPNVASDRVPGVTEARISPEARNYIDTRANPQARMTGGVTPAPIAAQPVSVGVPKPPSMLQNFGKGLGYAGKIATPIAATLGAASAIQQGTSNMDDQIARETMPDNPNDAKWYDYEKERAIRGAMVNTTRQIGNTFIPDFLVKNAGDKVVGGLRDMIQGNELGTTKFEQPIRTPQPVQAQQPVQAPLPVQTQPVQPAVQQGEIEPSMPTNQGMRTSQQVISGNAAPDRGFGAIQRTDEPGHKAVMIGGASSLNATQQRLAQLTGEAEAKRQKSEGLRGGSVLTPYQTPTNVQPGSKNDVKLRTKHEEVEATKMLAIAQAEDTRNQRRQAQSNTDREFGNKVGEQNVKYVEDSIRAKAEASVPAANTSSVGGLFGTTPAARKDQVEQARASLKKRFDSTVADSKVDGKQMNTKDMNPTQVEQVHQAMDIQDKFMKGRDSGFINRLATYFDKPVDSKNAFNFSFSHVTPAARPGEKWIVHSLNGNQIALKDLGGGEFSLWGQNKPIDGDLMALVEPLIKKAKEGK